MTLRTCKHSLTPQPNLGGTAYWSAVEMFTSINSDREPGGLN
jgi:hypothetical protein